jgi:glucosamine-phosphate N-acetyltransferase
MNGTTHSSTDSLFPASLISPAVAAALPEAYTIRPLQRGDYAAGFLDVLRVLTTVGEVPQADFEARFDEMKQTGNGAVGTHVLVILDGEGKVVGTGALLVERKLYVLCMLPVISQNELNLLEYKSEC